MQPALCTRYDVPRSLVPNDPQTTTNKNPSAAQLQLWLSPRGGGDTYSVRGLSSEHFIRTEQRPHRPHRFSNPSNPPPDFQFCKGFKARREAEQERDTYLDLERKRVANRDRRGV